MYRTILRRCGLVLVVLGVLDVGCMIWCVLHGISYQSSLNLFAVVAGILLMRGGLKTARWVASLSTFALAAMTAVILTFPFLFPPGYWLAVVRHDPVALVYAASLPLIWALFYWVRRQMLHPAVRQAQAEAGLPPPSIQLPLTIGVGISVLMIGLLIFLFRGDSAREAVRRAQLEFGPSYHYAVTKIQVSSNFHGRHVVAIVAAYNETELKQIPLEWSE